MYVASISFPIDEADMEFEQSPFSPSNQPYLTVICVTMVLFTNHYILLSMVYFQEISFTPDGKDDS